MRYLFLAAILTCFSSQAKADPTKGASQVYSNGGSSSVDGTAIAPTSVDASTVTTDALYVGNNGTFGSSVSVVGAGRFGTASGGTIQVGNHAADNYTLSYSPGTGQGTVNNTYAGAGLGAVYGLIFQGAGAEHGRLTGSALTLGANVDITMAGATGYVTSHSSVTAGVLYQDNQLTCATGLTTDAAGGINGCVASDRSLKTAVSNLAYKPGLIDALRPVSYRWKPGFHKDSEDHIGFVAQDMEKVLPEPLA